jgi:hypothetical protein
MRSYLVLCAQALWSKVWISSLLLIDSHLGAAVGLVTRPASATQKRARAREGHTCYGATSLPIPVAELERGPSSHPRLSIVRSGYKHSISDKVL